MAIETIGGREYYTKAVKQAIDTDFVDVPPNTKAILFIVSADFIWRYTNPDGSNTDITLNTDLNGVVNIIPDKISKASSSSTIYFLF